MNLGTRRARRKRLTLVKTLSPERMALTRKLRAEAQQSAPCLTARLDWQHRCGGDNCQPEWED